MPRQQITATNSEAAPAGTGAVAASPIVSAGPEPDDGPQSQPRPVVLLLEDDDDARSIYRDMLVFAGFDVLAASNGLEGLRQAEARRPDVVVTDLHMPEMNGVEVARTFRADLNRGLPIIAVTADSLGATLGPGWEESRTLFDEVLIKPVSPGLLVRAVRGHLPPG